jgi:hypothetical protein
MRRTVSARIANLKLRSLRRYHPLEQDSPLERDLPDRLRGEIFIGVYWNVLESLSDALLITTFGIRVRRSTGWVMLDYDDIGEIIYPHREDYEISDHLRIRTLSGTAIDLPICGGRGRFRDVWPFIRFIRRVLWEPESPGASG